MSIINQLKPNSSLVNGSKAIDYESWDTIVSTWASEIRTWDEMVSNLDGFAKPSTLLTNVSKP